MSKEEEIKAGKSGNKVEDDAIKAKNDTGATQKEEKVEVSRSQLAQILKDNEEFRKKIGDLENNAVATQPQSAMAKARTEKGMDVNVRMWNDRFVIGFENVGKNGQQKAQYEVYNPVTGERKQYINVILQGDTKSTKLEYVNEYLTGSVRVLKRVKEVVKKEPTITVQGLVSKKDFVENGYGMYETMVQVPIEDIVPNYAYIIELNGEDVEVPSALINN